MSVGRFLWILWAGQCWGHFWINFCTGYKLPTFWEYNSVEIIHQRVSVRPLGVGFRNVHFYIHIGYKLPTFGEYMSVGWYWIYPANYWRIYIVSWRVSAPGPNSPGPNCPPWKSGQLGPGAQLSAPKKWTVGPRGRNPPTAIYPPIVGRIYPIPVYKFNGNVFPKCWQHLSNMNIYTYKKCTLPNPAPKGRTLTLWCIISNESYSQTFGSFYPIQIYISKCTFPNPAPKEFTETLLLIVGRIYRIQICIL